MAGPDTQRIGFTIERWQAARKHNGQRLHLVRDVNTQTRSGLGPFTIERDASIQLQSTLLMNRTSGSYVVVSANHRNRYGTMVRHAFEIPLSEVWDVEAGEASTGELADPEAERPRKWGQKPEDTDEITYIGVDHPGIQWLWDDLGLWANTSQYCSTYDSIVEQFGIPGRKRKFNAKVQFGAAEFSGQVEARSQEEADRLLRESTLASIREALAE